MPNWCANLLEVVGPEEDLKAFTDKAKGKTSPLSFERLMPYPEGNWDYDWCINNWGTKWDVDDNDTQLIIDRPNRWVVVFDSAWSPPVELFDKVSDEFPTLSFRLTYGEPGMDFADIKTWNEPNWGDANYDWLDDGYGTISNLVYGFIHNYG